MSNQVYIPPINFNENENNNSSSNANINAIEPLEYNKINSNLSIKAATENNYGVLTTGDQNIKGHKNFINGIISEDAIFINLELTNGTITSEPTNNIDIVNKGYVDAIADEINDKTADMAKYDTSTNYLISNKTNSNITDLKTDNLNISSNYINKEPNTVLVRARGAAGTFDKYITIYKSILNGRISIIFDKNLDFNNYSNVTDVSLREMIFNISDMSNISQIYEYLPNEFELTGEVSTYGGTRNIATKTLKFRKSPTDLYKYDLIYDKSFSFNIFKLKESIKNIDTVINTTEIQKINSLTIDKGYLINAPTENNNLVNKGYVDSSIENAKSELNNNISTKISQISEITLNSGTLQSTKNNDYSLTNKSYVDGQINKTKLELNGTINSTVDTSINNAKSELNQNITDAINNIQIENVNLTTGTISTDPTNETDITNKKYVDKMASDLTIALNNINSVNLTTGTISKSPTNDTDITNKNYVDTATTTLTNKIDNLKSYSESNFIKYDSENNKLIKSSTSALQLIDNLNVSNFTSETTNITNLTSSDISISNSITMAGSIADITKCESNIENYQGEILAPCTVNILKILFNNKYFVKVSLNFSPLTTVEKTFPQYYIKHLDIPRCGTSQIIQHSYFYRPLDSTGNFSSTLTVGRFHLHFYNGITSDNEDKYIIQLGNNRLEGDTEGYIIGNNQKVFWIPDFTLIYNV